MNEPNSVKYFREFYALESDGALTLDQARAEFNEMLHDVEAQVRKETLEEVVSLLSKERSVIRSWSKNYFQDGAQSALGLAVGLIQELERK